MQVIEAQYLDHWGLTITSISNTSVRVTAAQIDQIRVCCAPLGCTGSAAPNGGYVRVQPIVIHSA
jgi:hypothetical protein